MGVKRILRYISETFDNRDLPLTDTEVSTRTSLYWVAANLVEATQATNKAVASTTELVKKAKVVLVAIIFVLVTPLSAEASQCSHEYAIRAGIIEDASFFAAAEIREGASSKSAIGRELKKLARDTEVSTNFCTYQKPSGFLLNKAYNEVWSVLRELYYAKVEEPQMGRLATAAGFIEQAVNKDE